MKNRLYFDTEEYNRFFNTVGLRDNTPDKQLVRFYKWCYDNEFFENITDDDISDYYIYNCLPCLKNNGICIGGYPWVDGFLIGIDPSKCYEKPNRSSIIIEFPITSKREENKLYRLLDTIVDDKQRQARDWKKAAKELWNGDYAKF